jgi:hypothetical protein
MPLCDTAVVVSRLQVRRPDASSARHAAVASAPAPTTHNSNAERRLMLNKILTVVSSSTQQLNNMALSHNECLAVQFEGCYFFWWEG